MRGLLRGALGVGLASAAGLGVWIATTASAAPSPPIPVAQVLRGTVPRLVSLSRPVRPVKPTQQIRIALPLRLPNAQALDRYVTDQYTPGSLDYRRFLTPAQFSQRFGAPRADVQRARSALRKLGLSVGTSSSNALYLTATGSAARLERVFGVRLELFRATAHSARQRPARTFYANTSEIKLPGPLSGLVTGVIGLDDVGAPQSQVVRPPRRLRVTEHSLLQRLNLASNAPVGRHGGATPCAQAVASTGYTAPDLAQGYDFNGLYAKGFHGEGMSVALVEFDDYHDSNVAAVKHCYGVATTVSRRLVDGGVGGPPAQGEVENMADITAILSLDPKLSHLYVYEGPITGGAALFDQGAGELDLYNAFVRDDKAPVLSASWGFCEEMQSAAYNQLFGRIAEEAAAQGQQILDASGDSGAVDCPSTHTPTEGSISVEQESAVPWVTAVGGTDLGHRSTVTGSSVHDEATWNDSGAGGGGQSNVWTMPSWQAAYLAATHDHVPGAANDCHAPAGQLCRMVPDIAMNADPDAGGLYDKTRPPQFAHTAPPDVGSPGDAMYCGTKNCGVTPSPGPQPPGGSAKGWFPIGGTSLAAPTAAAAAVLWDQEAKAAGLSSYGFLNPALYRIASQGAAYARDFHDVTTDTNDAQYDKFDCPPGCNPHHLYRAARLYDMASGLGSVDAGKLGADLVRQAAEVTVTPSNASMYGYLNGPSTTQPVSVTSGFLGSTYAARSSARWLHVRRTGKVPGTLSWSVDPKGLSRGTRIGRITVTGRDGSTATLRVRYSVGPRARIAVRPGRLRFHEFAVNARGAQIRASCGRPIWNDEMMGRLKHSLSHTRVSPASRRVLRIGNSGKRGSTLHFEAFFETRTSGWLSQDYNPHNRPHAFQVWPSPPLVPSTGAVRAGRHPVRIPLASVANANTVGGYPPLHQGTYKGVVEIRDLADPSVLVKVPVTLVLGNGRRTPRITPRPAHIQVAVAAGGNRRVHLVLVDPTHGCGYVYSLQPTSSWITIPSGLRSGVVSARPARSAPPPASATGQGNGFTPLLISAKGLSPGVHRARVIVQSENAADNPRAVPVTVTVRRGG